MSTTKEKRGHREKNNEKADLKAAQVELVKLQRHIIETGQKVLVIVEGRDAAGKDGTIKRIVRREARVVPLGTPSDRDRKAWYFQRYVEHLPVAGEIVLFLLEREYDTFLKTAPIFEELLVHCRITLVKYYLDISKEE